LSTVSEAPDRPPSATNNSQNGTIWGPWLLISGILVTCAVIIAVPPLWEYKGGPVSDHAWIIVGVTVVGLVIKITLTDLVNNEFKYYKHGYDLCVLTFGGILSAFSLQMVSKRDLFPGLSQITYRNDPRFTLGAFFLLCCLFTVLTARIAKDIRDAEHATPPRKIRWCPLLQLFNFSMGAALLGIYVLTLITKA
jgi:hypothetical protein